MARFLFVAAAAVAALLILALASKLSFLGDEWAYIVLRRLTFESMLQPHNEHLVFLHVLVYRGLVELVGTGSYLPFMGVLMACHVAMAAGVFALMRQVVPLEGALAAAVLLLFLGSGFDNLFWAFQMGFVGAAAFGVWAMAASDRPWLAALLLTGALWTQGNGLFYVAPVALLLGRRLWWVVGFPVATYAVWFVLFDRGTATIGGPFLDYAVRLAGSVVGGIAGVGPWLGLVVLALIVVAIRHPSRYVVAGAVGLASQIAILTLTRAHFGADQAEAPRYIYVAAPFVFLLLSGIRLPRPVWGVVFAVALTLNVLALPRGVAIYEAFGAWDRTLPIDVKAEQGGG
jgi:hypothetical protein